MRDVLAGVDRLPFASFATLAGSGAIVVLAPHPDDESIGCGGLIAAALEQGRRVEVIIVTDGSGSHPNSPTCSPERLAAIRRDEVTNAVAALGLPQDQLTFLGLRDTAAPIAGPAFDAAVGQIGHLVDDAGATAIFTTWTHDPHCDHEAAAAMAAAVGKARSGLRIWHYPIWGLHRAPDDAIGASPRGFRFDVEAWLPAKRRAIETHASQRGRVITDDPNGFALTEAMLAPFLGPFERFLEPDQ